MNSKEFGGGLLYTFSNYVYWFILLNLYFVLTNIVFILFLFTLERDFSNISLYFLGLIPTGPALSALYYCIGKIVNQKELSPTNDFFEGYRKNFKDSLKLWFPSLVILFILVVDLQYFMVKDSPLSNVLSTIFLLLIVLFVLILLYAIQINTFYSFRLKDIYRLSAYYIIMKLKASLGNLGILFITMFVAYMTSDFLMIFIASIIFFLIYLNSRDVLQDVKINFTESELNDSED